MGLGAPAMRIPPAGCTVRTIIENTEQKTHTPEPTMPKGVYERKPRNGGAGAAGTPPANAAPKRRGRPPKAANGSLGALLASMRAEREKLIDKVAALGTAIEALEEAV